MYRTRLPGRQSRCFPALSSVDSRMAFFYAKAQLLAWRLVLVLTRYRVFLWSRPRLTCDPRQVRMFLFFFKRPRQEMRFAGKIRIRNYKALSQFPRGILLHPKGTMGVLWHLHCQSAWQTNRWSKEPSAFKASTIELSCGNSLTTHGQLGLAPFKEEITHAWVIDKFCWRPCAFSKVLSALECCRSGDSDFPGRSADCMPHGGRRTHQILVSCRLMHLAISGRILREN